MNPKQYSEKEKYKNKVLSLNKNLYEYDKMKWIIGAFMDVFKSEQNVINKHNTVICNMLGVPNTWHPLYKQGNYKKYTDDEIQERKKEQNKISYSKYRKTAKGKFAIKKTNAKYYKNKTSK